MTLQPVFPAGPAVSASTPPAPANPDGSTFLSHRSFALAAGAIAAQIAGEDTAKRIQLLEYMPSPPFNAGEPDSAGPATTGAVLATRAPALDAAREAVAAARGRLALQGDVR